MPALNDCLKNTPRRTLLAIAQLNSLTPNAQAPKDELVELLLTTLSQPAHLRRIVAGLIDDERATLTALLAAGNTMRRAAFEHRFGPIRPYKPWRNDLPRRPWENPAGPGERPFYLGLIYPGTGPGRWGQDEPYVLIPDDLVTHLASLVPPVPGQVAHPPGADDAPPQADACHDIAALLGLLHAQDIRPSRRHWLPLQTLNDWNARCSIPDALMGVRHESQTNRLRTLHFLAKAAGLVGLTRVGLKPAQLGWDWLHHDRDTQLRALWQGWQTKSGLWREFRLPGYIGIRFNMSSLEEALPAYLPRLAEAVAETGPGHWLEIASFVDYILQADPPNFPDWPFYDEGSKAKMLTGFLIRFLPHLGLTHVVGNVFRFTPIGAWLLDTTPPPPFPPPEPLTIVPPLDRPGERPGHYWIELPPYPNLAHLARLESFAEWEEERQESGRGGEGDLEGAEQEDESKKGGYVLTPESLNRARGQGYSLEEIIGFLEEASGAPLPLAVRQALQAWERAGARLQLSRPALLECDNPVVLSQLAAKRRFRNHIVRTLSPRAVVLDDTRLPAAIRHLQREGHDPRLLLPSAEVEAKELAGRSEGAFHLLAGRVYQGLARFVSLPAPHPADLLNDLARSLPPAELAAAEAQAGRILDDLAHAIDGWTPLPAPQPGLDPDQTRPQIEQAIHEGHTLRLAYWTAGRGELTHRTVEPYRIEQRGNAFYLVAFCRAAQAERVFRLDRIQAMEVMSQTSGIISQESNVISHLTPDS